MSNEATDALRGFNLEMAELLAPTWEARSADIERVSAPLRAWMLGELDPRPGDTVLELAAGVGETGFEAAALIGEGGRLICSDASPAMLDAASRRGDVLGVTNAEYRVIDAEHIELDTDSVDGVLCRFGFMLMVDQAAALAETRRVLRPGGRLVLAVWGPPERNPFFTAMAICLVQRGHSAPPKPDGPGLFSMAGPERTTALLSNAGFGDVRTAEMPFEFEIPSVEEYVAFLADAAGPIALALRNQPADERQAITEQVGAALQPFTVADGLRIPGVALGAVAS